MAIYSRRRAVTTTPTDPTSCVDSWPPGMTWTISIATAWPGSTSSGRMPVIVIGRRSPGSRTSVCFAACSPRSAQAPRRSASCNSMLRTHGLTDAAQPRSPQVADETRDWCGSTRKPWRQAVVSDSRQTCPTAVTAGHSAFQRGAPSGVSSGAGQRRPGVGQFVRRADRVSRGEPRRSRGEPRTPRLRELTRAAEPRCPQGADETRDWCGSPRKPWRQAVVRKADKPARRPSPPDTPRFREALLAECLRGQGRDVRASGSLFGAPTGFLAASRAGRTSIRD